MTGTAEAARDGGDGGGAASSGGLGAAASGRTPPTAAEVLNPASVAGTRVLILYTGGTMGMQKQPNGSLGPVPGALAERLRHLDELQAVDAEVPQCWLEEFSPLLDSADICPTDWSGLAEKIERNYYEYDGFVIVHGTDTMAYTASALSFMLENLGKPVVLTGAQLPIFEPISDARRNLVGAILMAGCTDRLHEVVIYFDDQLLRGNRSIKIDATAMGAFASPNFPQLATLGVRLTVRSDLLRPPPRGRFRIHRNLQPRILVVRLVPGFDDVVFEHCGSLKGLVLLLYGCGNAPARRKVFLEQIKRLVDSGVIVVACSQCPWGAVSLGSYAVGKELQDRGVVSAGDMTTEATCTKLAYLLARDLTAEQVKAGMALDLRGEITVTDSATDTLQRGSSRVKELRSLL